VTAHLQNPLEAANGFAEPELTISHTHKKKRLHIARTPVRARQKTPVRVMNMSDQAQAPAGGITLDRCKPVTCASPTDDLEPELQKTRGLCEQLQRDVSSPRPNLCTTEAKILENFIGVPGRLRHKERQLKANEQSLSPYRHRRHSSDPSALLQTPAGQAG
jgi:hypothetical protein